MDVIEGRSRSATARAAADGEVEVLTARQFLERVSSDPALASDLILRHFACMAEIAELLCNLQQAYLRSYDLLLFCHIGVLLKTPRRGAAQPRPAPRPASACDSPSGPEHRLSD
jgi:CRP-like cAMP-binding protein